jgi:hypothetical protein
MSNVRDTDILDLVAGVVNDARALVEAQVSSLKHDPGRSARRPWHRDQVVVDGALHRDRHDGILAGYLLARLLDR